MIKPHGSELINKIANIADITRLEETANNLYKLKIPYRSSTDCEMIANGGFSPLVGFMNKDDAENVINYTMLSNGIIWAIPILLPVDPDKYNEINLNDEIALYDERNILIALMKIEDKFTLDLEKYCQSVFKTNDINHPGVKVVKESGNNFIGGEIITLVNRPERENIDDSYYRDPAQVRELFNQKGWKTIVAFQTRNPIHRAHEYLIKTAMEPFDGIVIHPIVGETKEDDIPADVRMQCYNVL
ncbi:MAG: sulfate adenylyltransferase, partial [Cyanobacteriota bacterium]